MKKYLFACLLLLSSISLFAQKRSTIYFISKKFHGGAGASVSIFINGQLIGSLQGQENLKYRIYSEGRMTITIVDNMFRLTKTLDVKNGNKYYFAIPPSEVVSEEKGQALLEKVKNTIEIVEDKTKPVGKLPEGVDAEEGQKQGTCFLVSKQGYLLTNYHVIKGAKKVQIKGISNDFTTLYGADVVAYDVDLDIALLKLKNQSISFSDIPYKISTATNAQGTKSFALGFPLTDAMGEEIKLTEGIISAKSGFKGSISQYQFSAAVQPGNSGSPLFNENGDVIGIVNAKLQGAEGAGYAIKSPYVNTFLSMVENLQIEKSTASTSSLSLADKVAKLKNYTFIVTTE